jgi:hypothetical protein
MYTYKIFKTQRGKQERAFGGFLYNLRPGKVMCLVWRCESRACSGAAQTENKIFTLLRPHDHESKYEKGEAVMCSNEMKERALTTKEKLSDIITRFIRGNDQTLIVNMPKYKSIIDSITKVRKSKGCNVDSLYDFFPVELKKTLNGEKFLFYR